ncbi:MAG: BMP family ABC transporter substrate-binding protein [Oscillospiraceae bacterium]|nr:BMP family ABC transporter substrate-binding protein [Oscillospiraceae bacterium]
MKKIIAMLLALVMVFALAACGKTAAPENAAEPTFEFDNDSTPFDVSTLTPDEVAKIKVGFIFLHDENSTYDLNFMNAARQACEGLGMVEGQDFFLKTGIPEGQECYDAAAELVDAGCNIVFADSFGHESFLIQAAKEFPEVQFCHATGTQAHSAGLPNFHNAFATIFEGRYLGGVAAGMKLNEMIESGKITAEEAKLGYIGAYPYAEVKSGYTSFFLGARSVCPSATMEVTFTNSWYDPTLEKEGAIKLINNGCVVLSEHADSMGAPTECEANGIPFVFYNGSAEADCPNTFIVASRINWVTFMQVMIGRVAKGETLNADWTGTLANGSVELTALNEKVAAPGTAEKLEEVKAGLINGTIKVFDTKTFTVDGKELTTYAADVNDLGTFTPDTESIVNGEFAESAFRSAPSFDIDIDGITIIDK